MEEFLHPLEDRESNFFLRPKSQKPSRLDLFLIALSRLKGNLGSEYLWILVGDQNILDILQSHRQNINEGTLGFLATVISQEEVLGPMTQKVAQNYIMAIWQNRWDELATKQKWKSKLNSEHYDLLWLRSYGNFATLIRECENLNNYFEVRNFHTALIGSIVELWEIENINDILNYHQTEVLDAVRNEWIYIWIRFGILDAGNRLIKPRLPGRKFFFTLANILDERDRQSETPRYEKIVSAEIHAIRSAEPSLLRAAGAMLLYKHLKRKKLIRDIDQDKIEIVA